MPERERGEKEIVQYAPATPDKVRAAHIAKTAFQAIWSDRYIPNGLVEVLATLGPVEELLGETALLFSEISLRLDDLTEEERQTLALLFDPGDDEEEAWQERALCAQIDTDMFFPEQGESTQLARRVCSLCDVRADCLDYALNNNEHFGIWGGLSARERRNLRKRALF